MEQLQVNSIKKFNADSNPRTISSREVAEMMEMSEHTQMLKKIDKINEILQKSNLTSAKYWKESSYSNGGRNYREYQVTKKGCELIAHKTEGEKGVLFTVKYMERFEQMEKELQQKDSYLIQDPIERAKAWIKEQEERQALLETTQAQQQVIGELKPKADYTDRILKSKSLVTITQIAKDYGMSGQAMNKLLHNLKVQYKSGSQWLLYADHQAKGYTHSETITYQNSIGLEETKMVTKWTQKGRLFLYELLKKHDVLPTIEQF